MELDQWLPQINAHHCHHCAHCVTGCPTGALAWHQNKPWLAHPELCAYCATCETVCPSGAITLPYLIIKSSHAGGTPS
jgi:MinD superfamily P-loop ATPase